jgi:hypothetical protein
MKILLMILIILGCSSTKTDNKNKEKSNQVESIPDLEGSKWTFKVVNGIYNYYLFTSDKDYKYYSAEQEDTFYGNYNIKNDTLYTFRNIAASDSLLNEGSPHRSLKTRSKFVLKNGNLDMVYNEYKHATGWVKTEVGQNIIYTKEN